MVMNDFSTTFLDFYSFVMNSIPSWAQNFINFFLLVLLIVLYSVLIWKFYRFIAKKNPLDLNLNEKYNPTEHSFLTRLLVGLLYFVEYALILPLLIFVVFGVFTLFLITLSQGQEISQIIIVSATIIMAIRMLAYYKEDLAKEVAKILPFMLLAMAVLNPLTFTQVQYIEKIIEQLNQIPIFLNQIWVYLIFIIAIEITLMFFDTMFSLFNIGNDFKEKEA